MYTRNKLIKVLKIKNIIFTVIGTFSVASSVATMISLISYYHDQLETVLTAKATPECIVGIIVGTIMMILATLSRHWIGDANFYSSYFESDLDGYIQYKELSDVTGKKEFRVRVQLIFFLLLYMKGYKIQKVNGVEQVVLNSKTALCECKNCGAAIEKRMYFTGVCSYCGSSDLYARVITENRFYSIENHMSEGKKRPDFYAMKNISMKKVLFVLYWVISICFVLIAFLMCMDQISKYNDKEYWVEVLFSGKGPSSFDLIRSEIMEMIIISAVIFVVFVPVTVSRAKRLFQVITAENCAQYFAGCESPIIPTEWLPTVLSTNDKMRALKPVRGAIRRRYLLNCTLEKHDGTLKVALAKKIVKDKCPTCYGAITGAVNEHYVCKYCNNMIMGVLSKK